MDTVKERDAAIIELGRNPRLAHAALFKHRHPQETPDAHYVAIDLWHSVSQFVLLMAFRGFAKSTIFEEGATVEACFGQFRNGIILGASETRAVERLASIRHEIETNQFIAELFGNLVGPTWGEKKIVLTNGVCLQAYGRGQSLRGAKHLAARPDRAFGDDMEDEESVATPEARAKFKAWVLKVVMPSLDPSCRFRIAGTPLDPQAFLVFLSKNPDWLTRVFPIEYIDPVTGERRATWPARFPLDAIDTLRRQYANLGAMQEYMQEYMCQASDPQSKSFTEEMFKVEPTVRTWHPVRAFYDPARTVKARSNKTGVVVWSAIGQRTMIWDAYARLWKPDEMIADMFRVNELYNPVEIGVEETGLNEFILQPLRHEMLRRNCVLPIKAMNAPKGKLDFIKGMQPFFKAGEVIFASELIELRNQLLSFPTGDNDIINALAYRWKMGGVPIYEDFGLQNIVERMPTIQRETVHVALNSTQQFTTVVGVQFINGQVRVVGDWISEGDPGTHLRTMLQQASIDTGCKLQLVAGPKHFGTHDDVGLLAAARKIALEIKMAGSEIEGREALRELMRQVKQGAPPLQVSTAARWTLNGFLGGYNRVVTKAGVLSDFAEENGYKVLMEGLESFATLLQPGLTVTERNDVGYETTRDGRRYISARAVAR